MNERAPAKVNLVLRVGPAGPDGMHELASLFASLDLADQLTFEEAARDEVICPGVEGENLAARALAGFRAAGGDPPALRVTIEKRIPVAAGLGGGSADAAAVLRVAQRLSPLGDDALLDVAVALGSDVPSQLRPGHAIVTGTGQRVAPVGLPPTALVLLPAETGLSTAEVYAELDRLRPVAPPPGAGGLADLAGGSLEALAAALENDLEPAAVALRPELSAALADLRAADALGARISGSGPTAFGLYPDRPSAERAAAQLPGALVAGVQG